VSVRERVNILLVDDEPRNILVLEAMLASLGETLVTATSGQEALWRVLETDFAAILLDVRMPIMDGFETARLIRSRPRSKATPIIFLTAADGSGLSEEEAYGLGAVDYLTKPVVPAVLKAKVAVFAELYRKTRELEAAERRRGEDALRAKEERFRLIMASVHDHAIFTLDLAGAVADWNAGAERMFGWTADEIVGRPGTLVFTPEDRAAGRPEREMELSRTTGRASNERWHVRKDGARFFASGSMEALRDSDGSLGGYVTVVRDRTAEKIAEELLEGQKAALELAIEGAPPTAVFDVLVRTAEAQSGALGSVLLLDEDGARLRHGAAPSLPEAYNAALDGVAIGPTGGSCGAAAFTGRTVIVRDIAEDPLWAEFRALALAHGLRACWSTPIRSSGGAVLGTFALYYREPREPAPADHMVVGLLSNTAAVVIERHREAERRRRAEEALRRTDERLNLLIGNITDYAVIITDPAGTILEWQGGAEAITGYAAEEAVGQAFGLIFSPEDRAAGAHTKELTRAARDGRADDRRWHMRKDGDRFFANGVTTALRDAAGDLRGFGKVFRDETTRARAEERQRFLADLAAATQPLTDPEAVTAVTARLLAEHLGVDRCAYAEIEDEAVFTITGDYVRGVPSIVGRWPVAAFGRACARDMRTNQPFVVADCDVDPRVEAADLPAYRATTMRAVICVPLHKDGRFTAAMAVHQARPRRWSDEEIELVRTVVGRCWEALERARATRRLAESEERFKAALTATSEMLWTNDASGKMTADQPGWGAFTGQTPAEYQGYGWAQAVHPDDAQATIVAWEQAVAERRTFVFEHRVRRHDGVYRLFSIRAVPVWGPGGAVREWVGTHTDITEERRRAELLGRVAAASRKVHASLSVDGIAAIVTEEARELLAAHRAVTSLTIDADRAQAVHAVSLSDEYAADRDDATRSTGQGIYAEVCRTNRPLRLTQEQLAAHPLWRGSSRAEHPPMRGLLAVPLVGHGGGNLGLVMLSDKVEGEFTAEDEAVLSQLAAIASVGIENARLYESLQDANRRKDEFLATLAHELRNPLAPLRTGLSVLRLGQLDARGVGVVAMMERQLGYLVHLVDDLLDVSRVTSGKIKLRVERLDLRDVVEAAIETSRPAIDASRHAFSVALPDGPLPLRGDRTRLAQALTNILHNACKYTPEGGRIELSAARTDGAVVVSVADTGVGIPDDMLPRVFEVFQQVGRTIDRAQGGLGLGLTVVKRLIEMHGGSVWAESPGPGQGSTFFARLPLVEGARPEPARPPSGPRAVGTPRRALVVDDNRDAADSLVMLLELAGHAAVAVYSGDEALAAARQLRPDVVFLDIGLPGMNGYEVAERLRAESAERACLVAVTGWGTEHDRARARAAGFDHHLTKPVEPEQVREVLARLPGRRGARDLVT
jgi:PAS domain S-box-containing protein